MYTADWILPVSDKPQRNGAMLVEDGVVTDMGHVVYLTKKYKITPQRFAKAVIAPSWVNAHCHLELSHLKNMVLRGNNFVSWVQSLVQVRQENNDRQKIEAAFIRELNKQGDTGTALVGDVTNGGFLEQADSRVERVIYYELLGFQEEQATEIYRKALDTINSHKKDIRLSAHALYSTSAKLVKLILSENKYSSIHAAESPAEMIFLHDGGGPFRSFLKERDVWPEDWQAPGQSPVKYLQSMGALHEKITLIHGVHVLQEDLQIIKQAGAAVCICIRSNATLGSGLPPVTDYLAHQIPLCIGSDSLASNSDLDMNKEVAYLTECFPQVDAAEIIRMATLNGAHALGKEDEYGSLSIGKKARFNVFSGAEIKNMKPEIFVTTKSWSDLICF